MDRRHPRQEIVELSVGRLGAQGDGVAERDGAPVFLPFTVPGDRVRAQLGAVRASGREGRVVEYLDQAAGRAAPACGHFGHCGGCALQHLNDEAYRTVKLGGLTRALARVGIDPGVVRPLRTVPPGRRRVRLGLARARDPAGPAVIGFRERFRHDLVDLRECPVLEPALFALIAPLRRLAPAILVPGGTADLVLTRTDSGVDLLIEAATAPGFDALDALGGFARAHDLARVVWRTPRDDIPIAEQRPVRVSLSGIAVPFPPGAFLQASAAAEAVLVEEVTAAIAGRRQAIDLFAGLGTFALAMSRTVPVHAVEGDPAAAAALAVAAPRPPRLTVERRDLERNPVPAEQLARYDAAVFDPPRAGARHQAVALAAAPVATVVAVSCNPATFARDAATLIAGKFRLERVTPVDQFIWTPHLELVAVFRR